MSLTNEITDSTIYLLSSEQEYNNALNQGFLIRDSIEEEGFIHASPRNQLTRVANKYYKKTIKPLILKVDTKRVTAEVKWEPAAGSLYPHIYGPLNTDAITEVEKIALNDKGEFSL